MLCLHSNPGVTARHTMINVTFHMYLLGYCAPCDPVGAIGWALLLPQFHRRRAGWQIVWIPNPSPQAPILP